MEAGKQSGEDVGSICEHARSRGFPVSAPTHCEARRGALLERPWCTRESWASAPVSSARFSSRTALCTGQTSLRASRLLILIKHGLDPGLEGTLDSRPSEAELHMTPKRSVTVERSERVSVIQVSVTLVQELGSGVSQSADHKADNVLCYLHSYLPVINSAQSPRMVYKYKANHGMSPLETLQCLPSSSSVTCRLPAGPASPLACSPHGSSLSPSSCLCCSLYPTSSL